MDKKDLFKELAILVHKVSKEQKRITIKTYGDYDSLLLGKVQNGLEIEKCLDNLCYFSEKEETKNEIVSLKDRFEESELLNYKLMNWKVTERNEDYEEQYKITTFNLLSGRSSCYE